MRKVHSKRNLAKRNLGVIAAAGFVVAGLASAASAAPTVDGTLDAGLYTRFATQTVGTQFGDNQSELDAGYYRVENGTLYVFLSGNLESNNNHLSLFFDTRAGGQNQLRTDNPDVDFNNLNAKLGGFTFDSAFVPDYFFDVNRSGGAADSQEYVNFSELNTNGGGLGGYLGSFTVPGNVPAAQQQGSGTVGGTGGLPTVTVGYNDANVAGVDGTTNAADAAAANAVSTGSEFAFDLASLGITGDFKFAAFVNGGGMSYLSNQMLAGFAAGQGNLGGDGTGNGTGTIGAINLNNFTGDQFVSITGVAVPTFTYALDANSNYSAPNAFTPSGTLPTGGNGRVVFGNIITAARTVTIDQPISLSSLTFNSANAYTLAGTNAITLNGNAATPVVSVLAGSHTISAPVILAGTTRFDVAASSALTLSGTLNAAGQNVFKQGAGTLSLPATPANSYSVNAGALRLTGTGNAVVRGVQVDTGATLDLTNGALVLDYDDGFSPRDRIKGYVTAGQLLSSTKSAANYAIGYVDTAALPAITSYNGTPLDATTLVFAATLKGDTNLDKTVSFPDLLALAQNYDPAGTGKEWYQGDSDYNGVVNFNDLLSLAQNYGGNALDGTQAAQLGAGFAADFALAQSLVPEPTTLAALGGLASVAVRRRRR